MQECFQASACIISANIPLAKPNHMPKFRINSGEIESSSLVGDTLKPMARACGHSEGQRIGTLNTFSLQLPIVLKAHS